MSHLRVCACVFFVLENSEETLTALGFNVASVYHAIRRIVVVSKMIIFTAHPVARSP